MFPLTVLPSPTTRLFPLTGLISIDLVNPGMRDALTGLGWELSQVGM